MKNWFATLWLNDTLLDRVALALTMLALGLAAAAGVLWTQRLAVFQIKEVVVTGLRGAKDLAHQNPAFIQRAVLPQLKGNYLTVQLPEVQAAFAQAAWIRHANVRRVWPNRLWVEIEEHQPVARLNEEHLINIQGEPFMAELDDSLQKLPHLVGAQSEATTMLARLRELNTWLASSQVATRTLYLSERRAWTAELSNALVLELGRDELIPRTQERVARWAKTWRAARASVGEGRRIDLRYTNGYAVERLGS